MDLLQQPAFALDQLDVVLDANTCQRAAGPLEGQQLIDLLGAEAAGTVGMPHVFAQEGQPFNNAPWWGVHSLQAIFGKSKNPGWVKNTIRIGGEPARIGRSKDAVEQGIYLVPEDRKRSGLILGFPVRTNITLASLPAHARGGIVDNGSEEAEAVRRQIEASQPPGPNKEELLARAKAKGLNL